MIIDIHTHSRPYSDDSDLSPTALIQHAKRSGLDGICLTEHDYFWRDEDIARLNQEHNFPVFPGVEINTEEGHLLVFGLKKYEFGMHHAKFVWRLVDKVGGIIILAHLYRGRLHHNPTSELLLEQASQAPIFDLVDAIETLNGRSKSVENGFAQKLCHKLKIRTVGGSDAHSFSDIPSCATVFEKRITTLKELIAELKAGRFRAADLHSNKQSGS